MIQLTEREDGVVVPVRAQPGARKNGVIGERAGALLVAVSAAPEKGKANLALMEVLAQALDCRPSRISLIGGATSRQKTFLVTGFSLAALEQRINELLGTSNPAAPR